MYSNPLNYYDPYGLFSLDPLWASVYWASGGWSPSNNTVNFVAGLGNGASFGLAGLANQALGQNVNTCSAAYQYGGYASLGVGVGRIAYAGIAKAGSKLASSAASAVSFRQGLKVTMRGGLFPNFRRKTYQQLLASGKNNAAIRASAGRTNAHVNTAGAQLAAGGAITTAQSNCGCP